MSVREGGRRGFVCVYSCMYRRRVGARTFGRHLDAGSRGGGLCHSGGLTHPEGRCGAVLGAKPGDPFDVELGAIGKDPAVARLEIDWRDTCSARSPWWRWRWRRRWRLARLIRGRRWRWRWWVRVATKLHAVAGLARALLASPDRTPGRCRTQRRAWQSAQHTRMHVQRGLSVDSQIACLTACAVW